MANVKETLIPASNSNIHLLGQNVSKMKHNMGYAFLYKQKPLQYKRTEHTAHMDKS